jgi:hypothetical protein
MILTIVGWTFLVLGVGILIAMSLEIIRAIKGGKL